MKSFLKTKKITTRVRHPIIKSRDEKLDISAGGNMSNTTSDALSSRLYEDNIQTLNGEVSYVLKDRLNGENNLNVGFIQGISWLGGREKEPELRSRSNGKNEFSKFILGANRLQKISKQLLLIKLFWLKPLMKTYSSM